MRKHHARVAHCMDDFVKNKLILTTACMLILPLTAFFTARDVANLGDLWSGLLAVGVAQIVIIGYVVSAFREDVGEDEKQD